MAKPMKTLELHYPMIQFLTIIFTLLNVSFDAGKLIGITALIGSRALNKIITLMATSFSSTERRPPQLDLILSIREVKDFQISEMQWRKVLNLNIHHGPKK